MRQPGPIGRNPPVRRRRVAAGRPRPGSSWSRRRVPGVRAADRSGRHVLCPPIGGHAGQPAHGPIRRLCGPAARGIVSGVGQRARQTGRRDRDDHPAHPLRPHLPRRRRHPPHAAADHHPAPTAPTGHRRPQPRLTTSTTPATPTTIAERRPAGPALDATKLWTGGLATAAVAALVGLVGTLVIRVLFEYAPVGTAAAHAFSTTNAGLLCLFAGVAALAATGVAHLLIVSTPDPLSYLGWIIGLSTAAAVVLPLLGGVPLAAAIAIAVVNLVIGLAIGSLVIGTAMAARRPATR